MTRLILPAIFILAGIFFACSMTGNRNSKESHCDCDTIQTKKIVTGRAFNRIPQYDTATFSKSDFTNLDSSVNRTLWYRDIENIDTTKFTNLWNDYSPTNYHASHLDFVKFYKRKADIELAFQFGPNGDLWAYHIFVIKKVGCCYLITRSYFRHARFTYKAYSIMNSNQVDTLYSILKKVNTQPIGNKEEFNYCGYFVDNRNNKEFFVDFEKEVDKGAEDKQQPKKEVHDLYEFVDKKVNWTVTYSL